MAGTPDRRAFLKRVAATAAGSYLAAGARGEADAAPPSPGGEGTARATAAPRKLSAYAYQSQVWVRIDDGLFACYRANPTQKYPYFYPIIGPATGLPMTEEAGVPYPHHRSLLLACDHVNGGNYWQQGVERGQIVSRGPTVESAGPDRVALADACDWRQPGHPPIIEDHRQYTFTAPSARLRIIDADVKLTAKVDVHVTKTNHSLFAIRAARPLSPAGGGMLVNANGQVGEKQTFGQVAAWCGYYGKRLGATEAITLIDHPGNPWSPCRWFTRGYGFVSPTPFNWLGAEGWRLGAGESIRLRYRVVVSQGVINAGQMGELYRDLAAST